MATSPTFFRTVLVASMPETDWASAQTSPGAANLVNVAGSANVGVMFKARDAAGAVVNPPGTVDLQPITVATSSAVPSKGKAAETIVKGGAIDADVAGGIGLTYSTQGAGLFTVRVSDDGANLGGGVVSIDLYWNAID